MRVITSPVTYRIDMTAGYYTLDNEGSAMQPKKEDIDRRIDKRLELPLQISLYDQSGETVNISATGVYFEIITDDIDAFSPGEWSP